MWGKALILYSALVLKILNVNGHCIDIHSQVVSQGLHYVPGPNTCTLCICDKGSPKWCKSVLCSPPQNCKSFQVGNSCCEFKCLDDILTANDGYKETYDLALRLIASAITAILSLSLLFFLFHRLRRRKGRVHQNRQLSEDQRSLNSIGYITGNLGYIPGNIGYLGSANNDLDYHYEETSAHFSLWKPVGNYFPRGEAPPPYEEAVRSAQAGNDVVTTQMPGVTNVLVVNSNSAAPPRPSQSIQVNAPNITVHHSNNVSLKTEDNIATISEVPLGSEAGQLVHEEGRNVKQVRTEKSKISKSFENIINAGPGERERPTTSSFEPNKKSRAATAGRESEKNPGKHGRYLGVGVTKDAFNANAKKLDKSNDMEHSAQLGTYCNISEICKENLKHRTIPNLLEYQQSKELSQKMRMSKSKDSFCTLTEGGSKRRELHGEQPGHPYKDRKDTPLHRTLPKNLRELARPYFAAGDVEINSGDPSREFKSGASGSRTFSKHLGHYDPSQPLGFLKSHISLMDNKPNDVLSVPPPIRLSILEITSQQDKPRNTDKFEERSFISYQCLSSSQEEDDYRSECENCKASGFTNVDEDETDILNETMTLQRRPLELGEEISYYRTSLTLPTHTRKPRTMTPNPGRESWFVAMQETSSSDESN